MQRKSCSLTVTSLVFVLISFCVAVQSGFAQLPPRTSVAMGREIEFRLTTDVNPESVQITVVPQRILRARLDTDRNRFVIEGVAEGTARVTFAGTSRLIAVAGPKERGTPFRHVVDVTVLPPDVRTDSRVLNVDVSRGSKKDFKLEVLIGMAFSKPNEEGYRWRNVSFSEGNARVAEGLYDANQMKLRVSGIEHGRTTMILRGEQSEGGNGVWQRVVREIRVKVGTGIAADRDREPEDDPDGDAGAGGNDGEANEPEPPQTSEEARDEFINAIQKTYDKLKAAATNARSDSAKRAAVENELRNFIVYLESQIEKEEARRPPSGERIAKLGDLLDLTREDLSSLASATPTAPAAPKEGSLAEIWSAQMKANEASKVCPANPRRELGPAQTVYFGNGKYFALSPVCLAAVHAGKITFEKGGTVKWRMVDATFADEQASIAAGPQPRNGVKANGLLGSCTKCAFVFFD